MICSGLNGVKSIFCVLPPCGFAPLLKPRTAGNLKDADAGITMFIYALPRRVVLVVSAILLLPIAVIAGGMIAGEAYYESWEHSRTDTREIFWMQEPLLHKFKKISISIFR